MKVGLKKYLAKKSEASRQVENEMMMKEDSDQEAVPIKPHINE